MFSESSRALFSDVCLPRLQSQAWGRTGSAMAPPSPGDFCGNSRNTALNSMAWHLAIHLWIFIQQEGPKTLGFRVSLSLSFTWFYMVFTSLPQQKSSRSQACSKNRDFLASLWLWASVVWGKDYIFWTPRSGTEIGTSPWSWQIVPALQQRFRTQPRWAWQFDCPGLGWVRTSETSDEILAVCTGRTGTTPKGTRQQGWTKEEITPGGKNWNTKWIIYIYIRRIRFGALPLEMVWWHHCKFLPGSLHSFP